VAEKQKALLVDIDYFTVEKANRSIFYVTVEGKAPTSGWTVNLHPTIYVRSPKTWVIQAAGIKPSGDVLELITDWVRSIEMNLPKQTQQVSVRGSNRTITKPVPWFGKEG